MATAQPPRADEGRAEGTGLPRQFLISTLLVAATLAFSLGINLGSFRQNCADTLFAAFSVVGDKAVGNIQEALGYGKPLDDFYGMEPILRRIIVHLPWVETVQVAMADGRIVETDRGRGDGTMREATRRRATAELARRPYWFEQDRATGRYALHVPIRNPDDASLAGFLIMVCDGGAVDARVDDFRARIVPPLLWTGLGTVALLGLAARAAAVLTRRSSGRLPALERSHRRLTLVALVAVQLAAAAIGFSLLAAAHRDAAERTTDIVARMVLDDIEAVIRRGMTYDALAGLDLHLDGIRSRVPALRSVALHEDDTLFREGETPVTGLFPDLFRDATLRWPLHGDRSGMAPELVMVVAGDQVARRLAEFGLDTATILVTSLLFMFELHRVLGSRRSRKTDSGVEEAAVSIRFSTFLMYFAAFLPVSFVPLMMGGFDRDLFGLGPVQAAAAPLTVEMICGVVAALAAGRMAGRLGWRTLALAGFSAGGAGMTLAAVTADPLVFVLARGLSGTGTMFGLIGVSSRIGRLRGRTDTLALQAGMFAGMYAGVNCGAVSGALLAASNGPTTAFLAGAAVALFGLLHTVFTTPEPAGPSARSPAPATEAEGVRRPPGRRRAVAGFLLLVSVPTAAAAMFQPFYLPLFVSELGLSAATVGRAYLMHGLCMVLAGPFLTRLAARRCPGSGGVLLSGFLIAAALALFGTQASLWTAFAAVLLIGLSESFGLAAQIRHMETLGAHAARHRETMLALHVNARKIGQAIGPPLFGALTVSGPPGVGMVGAGLAGSLLLFTLLARPWRTGPEGAP